MFEQSAHQRKYDLLPQNELARQKKLQDIGKEERKEGVGKTIPQLGAWHRAWFTRLCKDLCVGGMVYEIEFVHDEWQNRNGNGFITMHHKNVVIS